ncbi:sensor domain-containing diguanylate cyclase [Marinomonas ostreistagni]|uniref:sensor domain-containing diguanylate cyclase n=1 Tax=Marinomonas ostreistagni TaxID=359209 RepID=UPI001950DC8B|nr:sensor domain-containing diguanylate cyclase [Marinomonas ostreistagni]MBM6552012.1 diguanylate cyclase [Marinomonas ostreistagni]
MSQNDMTELHWLFDMLQHIDVGLVVINDQYQVQLWNGFMENHSGISSTSAKEQSLFDLFPTLNQQWLQSKLDNVLALRTPIYVSWEQRPHIFPFKSYRSITSISEKMFQNLVIRPINNANGTVTHLCLVVYDVTDVAVNKAALSAANRKLDQMSKTDGLTDLNNRASLDRALKLTYESYISGNSGPHSLVMADIDFFKKVNDNYGHLIGDQVLQEVAKILSGGSRRGDFVGRYGGEEFCVLLLNTNAEGARVYAEKIRQQIEAAVITTAKGDINITISMGCSELSDKYSSLANWIESADKALYQAKENGRNQTVVSQ